MSGKPVNFDHQMAAPPNQMTMYPAAPTAPPQFPHEMSCPSQPTNVDQSRLVTNSLHELNHWDFYVVGLFTVSVSSLKISISVSWEGGVSAGILCVVLHFS